MSARELTRLHVHAIRLCRLHLCMFCAHLGTPDYFFLVLSRRKLKRGPAPSWVTVDT